MTTKDTRGKNGVAPSVAPDPELVERAKRRRFTAEYKLRTLREANACTTIALFSPFESCSRLLKQNQEAP